MDDVNTVGWIITGCLLFVLIAVLFIVPNLQDASADKAKLKELAEEDSTSSSTRLVSNNTRNKPEDDASSDSRQVTIYSFSKITEKQVCRFCDGENSEETKVCSICKRDL